ncbi:hypothetical protein FIM08_02555 [SAR202 cluster bacterium AC-647-N09_OGT_505m]|nr:hypothetical protein [SAR202 cluster bacterium AC-647-N09_OGT_505m]
MGQAMYRPLLILFAVAGATMARPAYAHGFGERYDLPVPLEYYLAGAGAVVALSFVLIALFVGRTQGLNSYWRLNLLSYSPLAQIIDARLVTFSIKLGSVFIFLLIIATGIWGDQQPSSNFSPTFIWVIWWVGMGFFIALVGNVWALVNPWSIIYSWAIGLYRRLRPGGEFDLGYEYPDWLGVWPSFALFLGFAWLENSFPYSSEPRKIAMMVIAYSVITWGGMLLFGRHVWLRYGETFSLVFGFLARFAPTEVGVAHRDYCLSCDSNCTNDQDGCVNCYLCWEQASLAEREVNLRPYAVGLARKEGVTTDILVFVILMLATVTFDGFKATPVWVDIQGGLYSTAFTLFSFNALPAINTLGLLLCPALFLFVYLFFSLLMEWASGGEWSTLVLARSFVYSLIPIAIAYNFAHFFTLLAIQGQLIIPLASDPFGYGWDLLGTANYKINIGFINARFGWLLGVTAIVLGHVGAVYVSHMIALRNMNSPKTVLRSQYPMLALMVIYTVISLWIIAQPIVERT